MPLILDFSAALETKPELGKRKRGEEDFARSARKRSRSRSTSSYTSDSVLSISTSRSRSRSQSPLSPRRRSSGRAASGSRVMTDIEYSSDHLAGRNDKRRIKPNQSGARSRVQRARRSLSTSPSDSSPERRRRRSRSRSGSPTRTPPSRRRRSLSRSRSPYRPPEANGRHGPAPIESRSGARSPSPYSKRLLLNRNV